MAFGMPGQTEDSSAARRHVGAEVSDHFAGLRVPNLHEAIASGGSNAQAVRRVGAEGHTADFTAVLGEGQSFLALVPSEWGPIPDANSPVEAGRSEAVTVRAER